jgi:tetratricopeptide (TPR) repeat protein
MRTVAGLLARSVLFLAAAAAGAAPVAAPSLSISFFGGGGIPLLESATDFVPGFAEEGVFDLRLSALPSFLSLRTSVAWSNLSIPSSRSMFVYNASSMSGMLGAATTFDVLDWLSLGAAAQAGYYQAWASGTGVSVTGGGFCFSVGGEVEANIGSYFSTGITARYRNLVGLYQGFDIFGTITGHIPLTRRTATTVVTPPASTPAVTPTQPAPSTSPSQQPQKLSDQPQAQQSTEWLDVSGLVMENLYPVFYKHYADTPFGSVLVKNMKDAEMKNVSVSLWINKFMDTPTKISGPASLAPGAEQKIDLSALFSDTTLEITEATKVAVELTFTYTLQGQAYQQKMNDSAVIYDRNAITWNDDRKVAAFVSDKDPAVLSFSKNVSAIVKTRGNTALNGSLQQVMAMHQALQLFGLAYVPDPKNPYSEASKSAQAVDFLQFPRQTFEYKSGDCDDLTILYCSLMEAVGIETAAITIPGHIFMAFAIDTSPDEVRKAYLHPDDFIFMDGRSWIPVEVTERSAGFLKAWQEGAQEWRENSARQQADFIPIRTAWQTYTPVGLTGVGQGVTIPPSADVAKAFQTEIGKFVDNETSARVAKIQADIKKGETAKLDNSLGVLYARYGLFDRAEPAFQKSLAKEEYVPALLNLSSIAFSQKEYEKAASYADRASKKAPDNPQALLAVARVNHAMENYGSVSKAYSRLKQLDPDLASQFSYLDLRGTDAQKAADISNASGVIVWSD